MMKVLKYSDILLAPNRSVYFGLIFYFVPDYDANVYICCSY